MKKVLIIGLSLVLAGCISANIENTTYDKKGNPQPCKASYSSFFKDMDAASMGACGAEGNAENSRVNAMLGEMILKALMAGQQQ